MLKQPSVVLEHFVAMQRPCGMVDLQNSAPMLVTSQLQASDPDLFAFLLATGGCQLQSAISVPCRPC